MNITELQEELKKRRIDMPASDICRIWGMDSASFSRKKKAKTDIKYKNIQQLENALKINLTKRDLPQEEPITKEEVLKELEEIKEHLKNTAAPVSGTVKLVYRPNVSLSAGYGVEVYNEAAETFAIDARLLMTERGSKINPKYCEIVSVAGNSMYPEYREGDRVIINRADTTITDGQIYAIRYRGQCFVKEINLLPNKIKCISLNKEYDPFYIDESEDFAVIGRILPRIRL